jgi:glycosyltransferase involved in cell wall biosynthesis
MNRKTISIIVPIYAAEEYLTGICDRLSEQTYSDYEVLFVNDCSPDNSRETILNLAKSDNRIKYFEHTENRGQGAARNTGLENAIGEYIMYIDADDAFATNYLERMVAAIELDQADLAVCNSIWEYPDKRQETNMFRAHPKTDYRLLTGEETLKRYFNIYESDMWIPVEPWGKILRRSFIERHNIRHKETLFEDVVMTFNEIILAEKSAFIGDYLYFYNKRNVRAATVERQRQYIREIYRVPEGIFEVLAKYGLTQAAGEYATLFYFRYINGAYSYFAGEQLYEDEFRYTVEKYGKLLEKPQFGDMKGYVLSQLRGFFYEMKELGFSELFSLFLTPHRAYLDGMMIEALPQSFDLKREIIPAMKTLLRAAKMVLWNPKLLVKHAAWLRRKAMFSPSKPAAVRTMINIQANK